MQKLLISLFGLGVIMTVSSSFASGNVSLTGSVSTGSSASGHALCVQTRLDALQTIKSNLKTIKSNFKTLKGQHNGRWIKLISKDSKKMALQLHKDNRASIRALHTKLVDQYYANPASLTQTQYVDAMVTERTKFWDAISTLVASGSQDKFIAFKADYLTMFKTNRSLRYQNIQVRYNAQKQCNTLDSKSSSHKLFESLRGSMEKIRDTKEDKREKLVDNLKRKLGKLRDHYERKQSNLKDALDDLLDDIDEDSQDNEPNE
ncbi:MAG TPA: hypothetical protein PK048_04545 [Candidatus Absconditabacterales bacterium]|nr:hypothetical protein [Candidatus Absconditabacterales bacterium]